MSGIKYSICVLTVTYGDRWKFLEQVLRRVIGFAEISSVIVIDNASAYNVADKVKEVDSAKITVITNKENKGSAGGYKMALEQAFNNTDATLFLLLDDDNVPEENVFPELLDQWREIKSPDNKKALFCFRNDRPQHVMIAKGEDASRFYLVQNNFLGFNIFRIFNNQFYKFRDKFRKEKPLKERVKMPYVPYGGLLLHRSIINDIGYPDERFFLYVDDSEYTYRITQHGATIWLIPSCKIVDVDKSQGLGYKKLFLHSQLLDQWSFRTYYHVRNRIYFYAECFTGNKLIFKINKALYLAYLKFISMASNKRAVYKKLVAAVNDGLAGNMNEANSEKF